MFRKIFAGLGVAFLLLLGVIAFNTIRYAPEELNAPAVALPEVDAAPVAARLGEAIRFRTVSHRDPALNDVPVFMAFLDWLAQTYPGAHAAMSREVIAGQTPLYLWEGRNRSAQPILLTAHYDVVPVLSPEKWSQPAFDGVVAGGFVWGRGALDDKAALIAMAEAGFRFVHEFGDVDVPAMNPGDVSQRVQAIVDADAMAGTGAAKMTQIDRYNLGMGDSGQITTTTRLVYDAANVKRQTEMDPEVAFDRTDYTNHVFSYGLYHAVGPNAGERVEVYIGIGQAF